MADIRKIYQNLISIEKPSVADYWDHLTPILQFIDNVFFLNDELIYSYDHSGFNSFDVNLRFSSIDDDFQKWEKRKTEKFINVSFDVLKRFFLIRDHVLNRSIFVEIKSMVKYITQKMETDEGLLLFEPLTIRDDLFFEQAMFYQYMYSFFDKLNYIMLHLNEKYINKTLGSSNIDSKFYQNFSRNVGPFAKTNKDKEKISHVLRYITESSMWHYIRKLRNSIAHDYSVPSKKYNLAFDIKILYINICRVVFLLDATIKKDDEIATLLTSSKN